MKGKRYTAEQKIRVLREAERTGKTILDVCLKQQISEQTFHLWKREFGWAESLHPVIAGIPRCRTADE